MNTNTVSVRPKNRFNILREAGKLGSFDEFPMLRPEVDPQLHLSHNSVDQPFYLVCGKDCVIAQFSGTSRVLFHASNVRHFDLVAGDYVYVPAGIPHRILTHSSGNVIRYKAREPGIEAAVWYCESCDSELDRKVWNSSDTVAQIGYQQACERYNADPARRTCGGCGKVHAVVDLTQFRWLEVANGLNQGQEDD